MKLSDPQRREALRKEENVGQITNNYADIIVLECREPRLKKYENMTVGEIAALENKHPIDAMLDIACADGLNTDFYTPPRNVRADYLKDMISSNAVPLFAVSNGAAPTNCFPVVHHSTA